MTEYTPENITKYMQTYHQLREIAAWSPQNNAINIKLSYMKKLLKAAKSIPLESCDKTVSTDINNLEKSIELATKK